MCSNFVRFTVPQVVGDLHFYLRKPSLRVNGRQSKGFPPSPMAVRVCEVQLGSSWFHMIEVAGVFVCLHLRIQVTNISQGSVRLSSISELNTVQHASSACRPTISNSKIAGVHTVFCATRSLYHSLT